MDCTGDLSVTFNPGGNSTRYVPPAADPSLTTLDENAEDNQLSASMASLEITPPPASSPFRPQPPAPSTRVLDLSTEMTASTAEAELAVSTAGGDAVSDHEDIFPPGSAPALPAVTRKSRQKTASVPARKRPRTPSPIQSPQRSPIPVLRLFRNAENDEFMRIAKQIRKSRRIREQNRK